LILGNKVDNCLFQFSNSQPTVRINIVITQVIVFGKCLEPLFRFPVLNFSSTNNCGGQWVYLHSPDAISWEEAVSVGVEPSSGDHLRVSVGRVFIEHLKPCPIESHRLGEDSCGWSVLENYCGACDKRVVTKTMWPNLVRLRIFNKYEISSSSWVPHEQIQALVSKEHVSVLVHLLATKIHKVILIFGGGNGWKRVIFPAPQDPPSMMHSKAFGGVLGDKQNLFVWWFGEFIWKRKHQAPTKEKKRDEIRKEDVRQISRILQVVKPR
jgi:hypothetical protein